MKMKTKEEEWKKGNFRFSISLLFGKWASYYYRAAGGVENVSCENALDEVSLCT